MKKLKIIAGGIFLFALMQLGMQKGNELIRKLDETKNAGMLPAALAQLDDTDAEEYPEELKELLKKNPETEEFVKDYPNREKWETEIILSKKEKESQAPLFLQWDRRRGYRLYGDKMMAVNGCGPTCLSMVLVGLKGDIEMNPKAVADFSAENGYLTQSSGTEWSFMTEGARALGLTARELPLDESKILNALQDGHQIICSMRPGDFTTTGHFIVIYGERDGKLLIHDPNSAIRSEKEWLYEDIQGQIKNLWEYSV